MAEFRPRSIPGAVSTPLAVPSCIWLAGQSNAYADVSPTSLVSSFLGPDLLAWDGDEFVEMVGGGGSEDSGGHILTRVARACADHLGETVRCYANAWGGQALSYFAEGSSDVAVLDSGEDASERNHYTLSSDWFSAGGVTPQLLIWSQGEANGGDTNGEFYAPLHKLFASSLYRQMHIAVLRTGNWASVVDPSGVRLSYDQIAADNPHIHVIDVDDVENDGLHASAAGYAEMAGRVCDWLGVPRVVEP